MTVTTITTEDELNQLLYKSDTNTKGHLVVDFHAPWCGPCKRYAPRFQEQAEMYGEHISFAKVDVDEVDSLALRFGVTSLPTFIVFKILDKTVDEDDEKVKKIDDDVPRIDLMVIGAGGDSVKKLEDKINQVHMTSGLNDDADF